MSNPQPQPWSDNPNAPKISHRLYFDEKANLAGYLLGAILYGFIIVLFFQCITALFDPINRRGEPIKWGLVSYTAVIFSFVTVHTTVNLDIVSHCFIDNREFSDPGGVLPPGPIGYLFFTNPEAISIVSIAMFTLNNWLADGLLLYRCYVVYFKSLWVIAFPCLMFLGSLAMGIVFNFQNTIADSNISPWSGIPYYTISLSLNILLTLMIVIRLTLQARDTRTALGMNEIGGLCTAIVTMLIESCVLYAVSSLLVIGPWGADSPITNTFLPILNQAQVIAPLLIIRRVANRSTLTNNTVVSGGIGSFKAGRRWQSTGGSSPTSSAGECGAGVGELRAGVETTTAFHQDKT